MVPAACASRSCDPSGLHPIRLKRPSSHHSPPLPHDRDDPNRRIEAGQGAPEPSGGTPPKHANGEHGLQRIVPSSHVRTSHAGRNASILHIRLKLCDVNAAGVLCVTHCNPTTSTPCVVGRRTRTNVRRERRRAPASGLLGRERWRAHGARVGRRALQANRRTSWASCIPATVSSPGASSARRRSPTCRIWGRASVRCVRPGLSHLCDLLVLQVQSCFVINAFGGNGFRCEHLSVRPRSAR